MSTLLHLPLFFSSHVLTISVLLLYFCLAHYCHTCPGAKTIKKNTNSTQNKYQTRHAKQYEVTSFQSTDCELSTETCSKNVYSLGPLFLCPCLASMRHSAYVCVKAVWLTHVHFLFWRIGAMFICRLNFNYYRWILIFRRINPWPCLGTPRKQCWMTWTERSSPRWNTVVERHSQGDGIV